MSSRKSWSRRSLVMLTTAGLLSWLVTARSGSPGSGSSRVNGAKADGG